MKVRRFKINFRSFGTRVSLLYLVFAGSIYAISDRLYDLQIVAYSHYKNQALAQQLNVIELEPNRGEIYLADKDGNLQPLAINKRFFTVAVNPSAVTSERENLAEGLAAALGLPVEEVMEKLERRDDPYELLAKHLYKKYH